MSKLKGFRWSPYVVIRDNLFHPVEKRPKPFFERTIIIDDYLERRKWFTVGSSIGKAVEGLTYDRSQPVAETIAPHGPSLPPPEPVTNVPLHVPSPTLGQRPPGFEKEEKLDVFEGGAGSGEEDTELVGESDISFEGGSEVPDLHGRNYPTYFLKELPQTSQLKSDSSSEASPGIKVSKALKKAEAISDEVLGWAEAMIENFAERGLKSGAEEIDKARDYLNETLSTIPGESDSFKAAHYSEVRKAIANLNKVIRSNLKYLK